MGKPVKFFAFGGIAVLVTWGASFAGRGLTPDPQAPVSQATDREVARSCTTDREAFAAARDFYRSTGGDREPARQIFLEDKNSIEVTLIFDADGATYTIHYAVAPDCSVKFA